MNGPSELIFESDNVVAKVVRAADTSRWVVTFDNYSIGHGFDRDGFGENFLLNNGISAIHVMGRQEDWYQYPEMRDLMAAVRDFVSGAERVMTYGSSMGGYAAVRFAKGFGAHVALALSPQYSIDPEKVPFELRWISDSRRINFLPEIDGTISSDCKIIVAYDPRSADRKHADLIARDVDIEEIRIPFTGHPISTYLSETQMLKDIVLKALDGSLDVNDVKLNSRNRRRSSSHYYIMMSETYLERDPRRAIALAETAVSINPENPMSHMSLATALGQAGMMDLALASSERMIRRAPHSSLYLIHHANLLLRMGRPEAALEVANVVLADEQSQKAAHLHAWIGQIHHLVGDAAAYEASMLRARQLDPHEPKYRNLKKPRRDQYKGGQSRNALGRLLQRLPFFR